MALTFLIFVLGVQCGTLIGYQLRLEAGGGK